MLLKYFTPALYLKSFEDLDLNWLISPEDPAF